MTRPDDGADAPGVVRFDPGFSRTADCASAITRNDFRTGQLHYRGYRLTDLVTRCSFTDVIHLLIEGVLPAHDARDTWLEGRLGRFSLPSGVERVARAFPPEVSPIQTLAGMLTAFEERLLPDLPARERTWRLIEHFVAALLLVAHLRTHRESWCWDLRHSFGWNLMAALSRTPPPPPDSPPARALEVLLITLADHGQCPSTHALRTAVAAGASLHASVVAALTVCSGARHGGASLETLRQLYSIGGTEAAGQFLSQLQAQGGTPHGFGHGRYKRSDVRTTVLREYARAAAQSSRRTQVLKIALALEERLGALDHAPLCPAVELYSAVILDATEMPEDFGPCLFALARMAGWLAHWLECTADPALPMIRPAELYDGPSERPLPSEYGSAGDAKQIDHG